MDGEINLGRGNVTRQRKTRDGEINIGREQDGKILRGKKPGGGYKPSLTGETTQVGEIFITGLRKKLEGDINLRRETIRDGEKLRDRDKNGTREIKLGRGN